MGLHCSTEGLQLATNRLFEPLRQNFGGRRFHSDEKVEMAVRQWLRMQPPDFYRGEIFISFQDGMIYQCVRVVLEIMLP